jgi:hypothetical protein
MITTLKTESGCVPLIHTLSATLLWDTLYTLYTFTLASTYGFQRA